MELQGVHEDRAANWHQRLLLLFGADSKIDAGVWIAASEVRVE